MNFNFALSDALGLTRDIAGQVGVMYLDIENKDSSTGVLYMADEPPAPVVLTCQYVLGEGFVQCEEKNNKPGIETGMSAAAAAGIPAGAQVTGLSEIPGLVRIHLSQNLTAGSGGNVPVTFSAPALSAACGISLQPGQRREFTAEQGNAFLNRLIRLYAVAGTQCDVVVRRGKR